MDDLSYYRNAPSSAEDPRAGVFHAYLAAALQSHRYRNSANTASESGCDAWIALQSVEVNSSRYDFALLCRNGKAWTALRGGAGGEEAVISLPASENMDGLLSRSRALADGPRLGIGFDGLTSYVTTYDGGSVGRFAVYGVEGRESKNASDFRLADGVVRDLEHVIERASGSARQD
ncbi:hypothetical protein [Stenotrophomonas maltophilia]|uniref:Uncharacterized protein n=2 Tax=Stenotrophomonas TaxID=40323 RepID=A0A431UMP5_STEMA|nr:hypothetical protein [Stenotrophomonas maltophilia]RTQ90708.1 hypothetical protein EKL94_05395 [Stenotrophomonas maltophilia]